MKMMKKLLSNLGRTWEKIPKEVPVITVSKGTGIHSLLTVDSQYIHLHSLPYHEDLPIKQSILLEDLTINELVNTLNGMGYEVQATSEAQSRGFTDLKAYALLHTMNITIVEDVTLMMFSSKLWKILYPLARLLEEADNDIDLAIEQMYAVTTSGKWLDYWSSFFNIQRQVGENDVSLGRRVFMTLTNVKTNNIAIEELLRYSLKTDVYVTDTEAGQFEAKISPEHIASKGLTDSLINSVKGAGIDFFYHYFKRLEEDYPSYLRDSTGKPAKDADGKAILTLEGFNEMRYGWKEQENDLTLNEDTLNNHETGLVYTLDDSDFELSHEYHTQERYDKMQEKILPYLVYFNFGEVVLSLSEVNNDNTLKFTTAEPSYRYSDSSFELNSDTTNSDTQVSDQRVYEGGSMTLYYSDGTIAQSEGW